jgi:hypothetical protein
MAKKQSRRSVSLSRPTYERLRAYCEINNLSMSAFVETRIGDFLGRAVRTLDSSVGSPTRAAASPAPSGHASREDDAAKRIFTF